MGNSNSKKEKKAAAAAASSSSTAAASSSSSSGASTTNVAQSITHPGLDIKDQYVPDDSPVINDVPSPSAPEYQPSPEEEAERVVETGEAAVSFWNRDKTYRPQREVPDEAAKGVRIMKTVNATMKATLGVADLEEAVKCPPGEDLNEWIAVNTLHHFNAASLIYGTVQKYCTSQSCPVMAAGKAEYLWKDPNSVQYKKPTRLPAPVYIDLMMTEIDSQITDSSIFPVEERELSWGAIWEGGKKEPLSITIVMLNEIPLVAKLIDCLLPPSFLFFFLSDERFPRNFMAICKQIYKRLFRLYAHIYCAHHESIRSIGASAHLNTIFRHLVIFILQFSLVDRAEMAPLEKLIARITQQKK